jgi:hypothetical protein
MTMAHSEDAVAILPIMVIRSIHMLDNLFHGLVAILPIGIAWVSSMKLVVQMDHDSKKGDEVFTF